MNTYNIKDGIGNVVESNLTLEVFCVQETIGGWRQNPIMTGSLQECRDYMGEENTGNKCLSIVPEEELEIDYL